MSLSLKPLGDRLIVKPIEQDDVTAGGIMLPDTAKEKPQKGEVLADGCQSWRQSTICQIRRHRN